MSEISRTTCTKTTGLLLQLLSPFKKSKVCRASSEVKLFPPLVRAETNTFFWTDTLPLSCAGSHAIQNIMRLVRLL